MIVTALGNDRYHVSDGAVSSVGYAAADGERVWVFLNGRVHVIETRDSATVAASHHRKLAPSLPPDSEEASRRAPHADEQMALSSPMPATVIAVKVGPGDRVVQGDVMIMLEAMKMELPIKAPRDGIVKSIACREGELVEAGVALVELT